MAPKDRPEKLFEVVDMHGGKGRSLAYWFFKGEIPPWLGCYYVKMEPGASAGYHQHHGNAEIIYIISGRAENYMAGAKQILEAGDALLVKAEQCHAIRNIGEGTLEVIGFAAAPGGDSIGSVEALPDHEEAYEPGD